MAQWSCPICVKRLLTERDLSSIPSLIKAIRKLHFDHFMPQIKGPEYPSSMYWCNIHMVFQINPEKKSGYFVHCDSHSTIRNVV